jgi:YidC/Oxa1 family membrane protein insertase
MHLPIFDILLIQPLLNLLVIFYHLLSWVNIPYALGFSIILMTITVKLLLYPLTTAQLRISKKMQDLAPHLSKIKEKHKGDMKRQQEATMALYREHNVNPAAGCLPGIAQIVILLFGLYPALMKVLSTNDKEVLSVINHAVYSPSLRLISPWDTHFFGLQLGKTPADLFATVGPIILLIPVATGVFQFIQSKMMAPKTDPNAPKNTQEDFATMFQKQSMFLLPIMVAFFSWHFSVGLSLYWNTFTVFGIIQQYLVSGLGGLEEWITKLRRK